ncbi:PD-(D/E)XK nuclease family protein [Streptomyces sp. NPDC047990]|uniref:PD-(D/E)XK nuclease family protein n=1 Tax=Streptomyces sp. NPDC047990 TaxID=3365496 RepID=UPI003717BF60
MSNIETQPRSPSQTSQYEDCGWRWWLQRGERVEQRPAAWSHHGTAFHSAAEAFERSGRTMSAEEVLQVFSDQYSALTNKSLDKWPDTDQWMSAGRYTGGEDIERRYGLGQQQTTEYVAWSLENEPKFWKSPTGDVGLELSFMVELGGVKVRGFIDQLLDESANVVRVRDLKTGSTKSKLQLHTYSLAVQQVWKVEAPKADWYLAKDGRLSRPVKLTEEAAEETAERYAAMDAAVKRGDAPARPGFNCNFCDVSHACVFFSAKS